LGAALVYAALLWLPMGELASTAVGLAAGGLVSAAFILPEIKGLRRL
jgi:hypothetical protein